MSWLKTKEYNRLRAFLKKKLGLCPRFTMKDTNEWAGNYMLESGRAYLARGLSPAESIHVVCHEAMHAWCQKHKVFKAFHSIPRTKRQARAQLRTYRRAEVWVDQKAWRLAKEFDRRLIRNSPMVASDWDEQYEETYNYLVEKGLIKNTGRAGGPARNTRRTRCSTQIQS